MSDDKLIEFLQHVDEILIKDIVTEFYYHWHNSGGTNTADGFDDWWKLNRERFGFNT